MVETARLDKLHSDCCQNLQQLEQDDKAEAPVTGALSPCPVLPEVIQPDLWPWIVWYVIVSLMLWSGNRLWSTLARWAGKKEPIEQALQNMEKLLQDQIFIQQQQTVQTKDLSATLGQVKPLLGEVLEELQGRVTDDEKPEMEKLACEKFEDFDIPEADAKKLAKELSTIVMKYMGEPSPEMKEN